MAEAQKGKQDWLGVWIRGWDVLAGLALLAGSFMIVRMEALPQLLSLVADKAYFTGRTLLLDRVRHGYGFEQVRDHMRALGDDGRAFYAYEFLTIYDLANSLFVLTFSILFILYATQAAKGHALEIPALARKAMLVPPVVQFLCDVGENYSLRQIAQSFPAIDVRLVETASQLTQWKWLAIFATSLILIGLAAFTLYRLVTPASHGAARG
jgi:hypothetical protein